MTKKKIILLDFKSYYPSPPYQLGLLVAYASKIEEVKKNVEFHILEYTRKIPVSKIVNDILELDADLIAISDYSWNHKKICDTLNLLSRQEKLPKILIGGPNCSGKQGEEILKKFAIVSCLVEGEGEPAFADICLALVQDKDLFLNSKNCVFRDPDGEIVRPNIGHRINRLDDVPSPYLTGVIQPKPSPVFYETNRGCPYRCAFCYWGNGNSKVYRMSLERVREEMEFFAENRVRAFWLADANFGIFPSDAKIAEIIVDINKQKGSPFKSIGVNWAKNSSDRVLEIASIFQKGGISSATTIALQTVTSEAEEFSKRYSMSPHKFMNLIRSADKRNIDTYTDIIIGLPGESLEDFLNGIHIVTNTLVPSLKIHQLVLIPGTEFYDKKEQLGLLTTADVITDHIPDDEKSDYYDCTVMSNPSLSVEDMKSARYFMGIVHFLHNHNLGQLTNHFLSKYDISNKEIFLFMNDVINNDDLLSSNENYQNFLSELRKTFKYFIDKFGVDDNQYMMAISHSIWFKTNQKTGFKENNITILKNFIHDFYTALCEKHNCCQSNDEKLLLREIIEYNLLISPKPSWIPEDSYEFQYNVHEICNDIKNTVLNTTDLLESKKNTTSGKITPWIDLPKIIAAETKKLITDHYLESKRYSVSYTIKNPWGIPPSKDNIDWLVNSKSKHCVVNPLASKIL
ncbi:radical SAM protein [Dokdonia ponticola]|uniref:Radical SAM protein n=1 Tax=Dokdonia ponticola TaxID=2041041 RepID=A0ABV9HXP6_9FLAO